MKNNLSPQTSNHGASTDHTRHDDVDAPHEREDPDSVPTAPVVNHPTATEAARKAIEVAHKLSPTMREAVKAATEGDHQMLRVGWTGFVSTRTIEALARRGVVVSAQDSTLTDLGRFVFAVLFVGEEGTLAEAARRDTAEARERTETAVAERRGFSADSDRTFCTDCAVAIRVHATNTRPATHPEAGACGKRQDECEGMPMLPFTDWGTAGRTWQDWVTHVRRYREAADMDELHARALVEHEVREVAQQLPVRYYVRRVNDSEFSIVVDADHQNRSVSAMTRDLDEAKTWQRVAHRQWAEREVANRAQAAHDEDAANPEQRPATHQPTTEEAGIRRPGTEAKARIEGDDGLLTTLRGCMAHAYDADTVNRVFGQLNDASGVRLVCLWGELDDSQGGGNSMFFVEVDGQLHDLAGSLNRWLTGDPDDPNTPASPGAPASWVGPPADIAVDLTYLLDSDGLHNYGWQTFTLEERPWRCPPSQPHSPRDRP